MDYKDTLLMPTTNFPMRANLATKELEIQSYWSSIDLYNKSLFKNKDNTPFILHDGPPYANNPIHIGHAFQKTLKDFVLRFKSLSGYYTPYIPGWDTHGLPIEHEVTKKVDRKSIPVSKFREICYEFALTQVELQKADFMRLGILGRWDKPYLTLDKEFEASQILTFAKMVKKGLIYRGLKPIYWSPSSESALAEAEIEYQDLESYSLYVRFKVVDYKQYANLKDAYLLVWTTTPWTLPANLAVSINPRFNYAVIKTNNTKYLVLEDLLPKLSNLLSFANLEVLEIINGANLEYLTYKHPLFDKICPVILGEHVSNEDGTGLVHTAPGHGNDDYIVGLKYKLDVFSPVNEKGVFTNEAGKYAGIYYDKANEVIIEDLKESGLLVNVSKFVHSYPCDWRTKKPVIFRSTYQWFCGIDPLRKNLLKEIDNISWHPSWGLTRMQNMIVGRADWCISRQRAWGVPIPIFYAQNNEPILDIKVIEHVASLFKQYGSNIWFEKEAIDLLPSGYRNPNSPDNIFTKEKDIMDVWFDSGTSFNVLNINKLPYPADLYLEGTDQFRGWFNSSLIASVASTNESSYKQIVTHGFVLDGQGRKMSKSLGNTIKPQEIISTLGADVLRLWVSTTEYGADVRISKEILAQSGEIYRKIRNTFKYILGSINDFDYANYVEYNKQTSINKYMLSKLNKLTNEVINYYDNYQFYEVIKALLPYISNDLSAFYLDYAKDILYIENKDSYIRLSLQSALYDILLRLLLLLNPIIPHTTSEAYLEMPNKLEEDIFLCRLEKGYDVDNQVLDDFQHFFEIRDLVLKELENARTDKLIGKSNQASVEILLTNEYYDNFEKLSLNLAQLLIVSSVNLKLSDTNSVIVTKAEGVTCDRCWNVVPSVNENGLCPRCESILKSRKE